MLAIKLGENDDVHTRGPMIPWMPCSPRSPLKEEKKKHKGIIVQEVLQEVNIPCDVKKKLLVPSGQLVLLSQCFPAN